MAGINENDNQNPPPPPRLSIRDYMKPRVTSASPISREALPGNFELKTGLVQLVQQDQFRGLPTENPNHHLERFLQKCSTYQNDNISANAQRMRLFAFSLADKAAHWLRNHPPGHFTTWEQLSQDFIEKYFPPGKTQKLRLAMLNFKQGSLESLYEAWERYKDLQHQCPHHGLSEYDVINAFYTGLNDNVKMSLDASAGGSFTHKLPEEATELIERMASNNQRWGDDRGSVSGKLVDVNMIKDTAIQDARMDAMMAQMAHIEARLNPDATQGQVNLVDGDPIDASFEQLNYLGGGYNNPGGRSHPGLSYGNPDGALNPPSQNQQQQTRNQQQQQGQPQQRQRQGPYMPPHLVQRQQQGQQQGQQQLTAFEYQMERHIAAQLQHNQRTDAAIAELTNAVKQIGTSINKLSAGQGQLPSQTEQNPRPNANVNAIIAVTTRSGQSTYPVMVRQTWREQAARDLEARKKAEELACDKSSVEPVINTPVVEDPSRLACDKPSKEPVATPPSIAVDEELACDKPSGEPVVTSPEIEGATTANPPPKPSEEKKKSKEAPKVPFPHRLVQADIEKRQQRFVNLLKNIHLDIPFLDALVEIPTYAKYLKELITGRKKIERVLLTEECTEVIKNVKATKRGDPGSFTVPCSIGGTPINKALIDLGASVSLMPLSIYEKLNTGSELDPTDMTIQLADSSVTFPMGIARDVIVQLGGGIQVPTDFVVMDMKGRSNSQLILGRPFMNTAGVLIDVRRGVLKMNVGDVEVSYQLPSKMKTLPSDLEDVSYASLLEDDDLIEAYVEEKWYAEQQESRNEGYGDPGYEKAMEAFFTELNKQPAPSIAEAVLHQVHHAEDSRARSTRHRVAATSSTANQRLSPGKDYWSETPPPDLTAALSTSSSTGGPSVNFDHDLLGSPIKAPNIDQ